MGLKIGLDCERLERCGVPHELISPELMYKERHGDIKKKSFQANSLDAVFDDDWRIQIATDTVVFCPMTGGHAHVLHSGKAVLEF